MRQSLREARPRANHHQKLCLTVFLFQFPVCQPRINSSYYASNYYCVTSQNNPRSLVWKTQGRWSWFESTHIDIRFLISSFEPDPFFNKYTFLGIPQGVSQLFWVFCRINHRYKKFTRLTIELESMSTCNALITFEISIECDALAFGGNKEVD